MGAIAGAGRYAPSPSGPLHLGNLRTALLAWLAARSQSAPFMLRVEDLDRERSRRTYESSQLADLAAIGLDWDGPVMRQSDRLAEHREAFEALRAVGRAYPCWCTRADIRRAASAPHGPEDPTPEAAGGDGAGAGDAAAVGCPGACRLLSASEREQRARETGREPAWRLEGRQEPVRFDDRLHGSRVGVAEDAVLWRADGGPSYTLAVVVDDGAQGVREIVRGDDLLQATPSQALIGRLLGIAEFSYVHVPLVLGRDRRRLAKRDGAVTLAERLARGETVGEILGWMGRSAGLQVEGRSASAAGLLQRFDLARLNREPVVLPEVGRLAE